MSLLTGLDRLEAWERKARKAMSTARKMVRVRAEKARSDAAKRSAEAFRVWNSSTVARLPYKD